MAAIQTIIASNLALRPGFRRLFDAGRQAACAGDRPAGAADRVTRQANEMFEPDFLLWNFRSIMVCMIR
jgi:hypothetical protein